MKRRVLGVIPARLGSSRLPNKPLFPVLGRPLIEWVWRRVEPMHALDEVVVATDSEEIMKVCESMGAPAVMTSSHHPSGTDRVAEVAALPRYHDIPFVVNIQGDEPLLEERHLEQAIELVADGPWSIGTCATPLRSRREFEDPSVVKIARAQDGRALYFSRSPIPFDRDRNSRRRDGNGEGEWGSPEMAGSHGEFGLGHIGIYVYSREALEKWVSLDPSPLEQLEKLEQLRPLEAGLSLGVAIVQGAEAGIDTLEDIARVEARLRETGNSHVESGIT